MAEECCVALELALERQGDRFGLSRELMMSLDGKPSRYALVERFRKAKRGEAGTYGHCSAYASVTYALVVFCPFCGKEQSTHGR